jgi:hypothetical protein
MIDVKQAYQVAREALIELLGEQELADKAGITLEEFELSQDKKYWNITLGYPVRETREIPKAMQKMLGPIAAEPRRRFKTFRIDTKDGQLVAMKLVAQ